MAMEEGLRLKVVFEDVDILSDFQRSEGLDRSWLLLNPNRHRIISDFASYLLHTFQLRNSCPNGLLLSMDGFVLPPFESTCFFNDKDVISVKKKGGSSVIVGNAPTLVENLHPVTKQTVNPKPLLLANEVVNKKTGGYKNKEPEEEMRDQVDDYNSQLNISMDGVGVSKKRKASEKPYSSKKKKQCLEVVQEFNPDDQMEQTKKSNRALTAKKSKKKQERISESNQLVGAESNRQNAEMSESKLTKPDMQKNEQIEDSGKDCVNASVKPEEIRKRPSRSARRQYAKRRFIRDMTKILKEKANSQLEALMQSKDGKEGATGQPKGRRKWKKEQASDQREEDVSRRKGHKHWNDRRKGTEIVETPGQQKGLLYWKGLLCEDNGMDKQEHANPKRLSCDEVDQNIDHEDGSVPIEVGPDHNCSVLPGEEKTVQQNQSQVENFRSNGFNTNKEVQELGKRNEIHESNRGSSETSSDKKIAHWNGSTDFAKLPSLSGAPKEGDVIAFRLLELSSNWTANLSSYHVGKISSFNSESSRVSLVPVSGYPFFTKKSSDDECTMPPNSLYKEDGSLEIDLSSLIDVRIIKSTALEHTKEVSVWPCVGATSNTLTVSSGSNNKQTPTIPGTGEVNNEKEMHTCSGENKVDLWEQLSEALSAKKEQLSEQTSWGKLNPSKISWSHDASRGSGFQPRYQPRKGFSRGKNKRW